MILNELVRYYDRLSEQGSALPIPGFSNEKIHYSIVINTDGKLVQIDNIQGFSGKKSIPRLLNVPYVKRASNIKPAFLRDNAKYVFGVESKEKKDIASGDVTNWKITDKSLARFDAFREYHVSIAEQVNDPDFHSLAKFLMDWQPENFAMFSDANEMINGNFVFQILGHTSFLHEKETLRKFWQKIQLDDKSENGICLMTGNTEPIAKLHAGLKGIPGAQTAGASLISFNIESFCSYGKRKDDQALNAPVGQRSVFAYTTVLNHLLSKDSKQKIRIADASTVFWAEKEPAFECVFGALLSPQKDDGYSKEIEIFLQTVRKGGKPDGIETKQHFYVLGLSPNAARISVRFWYVNTVDEISRQLARHFEQIALMRQFDRQMKHPGLWHLLIETAVQHKSENIPPNLSGPLTMAVLKGTPYPISMLSLLLNRMRVEKDINYYKCSMIKGILIRNYKQEVSVALDNTRTDTGYIMGRLFAVLEKIQEESTGGNLNASIKDRYFASASTNPAVTFPVLIRLSQNHQKKLKSEKPGLMVTREKILGKIMGQIQKFPKFLTLEEQGLFAIGYYHQYQNFFVKKEADAETVIES